MNKQLIKDIIDVSMARKEADLCIKNAKIVDVYNKKIFESDLFIVNGYFASFSSKIKAKKVVDVLGKYVVPGFIDAHCHIESSHLSPAAFSDAIVPYGTTTVIADPHEICNVAGLDAMKYMLKASENIPLSVYLMFPSCVPATDKENAGAVLLAKDIEEMISNERILGLGEMMNYPGVINNDPQVVDKLDVAYRYNKIVDGHAPAIKDNILDAYSSTRILTDHECDTPEELEDRVRRGMYVMLRQGTACKNVITLVKGVNESNSSRCVFCTDDRQPQSIKNEGHINYGVNLAIKEGLNPITAIQMASLNASICYGLKDRGAIAPGLRADFFITASLDEIKPEDVYILGSLVAKDSKILKNAIHVDPSQVIGKMAVKEFSKEKLKLKLNKDLVHIMDIIPGGVVTGRSVERIKLDQDGYYIHDDEKDILKLAVVERHHNRGNVGLGLIRGYGMKNGAVASSIAHDSHNIIVIGSNDDDMEIAVNELISLGGGITIVQDRKVLISHRLELGGLMTDESAESVCETLEMMHKISLEKLNVNPKIDPFMTLCFMALPVIPELKLTDTGLFDVAQFKHIPLEVE